MNLTSALRTATSALASNAKQVAILSRNISSVGDENYVRRNAVVQTGLYGTTTVETQRHVNRSVYDAAIRAGAISSGNAVFANGLDRMAAQSGGDGFSHAMPSQLSDLKNAVELAAASPSNESVLTSLAEQGRSFAISLNTLYSDTLVMRQEADANIASSVDHLNQLLSQLEVVNTRIVNGTRMGEEITDSLDIRDQILDKMSEEIGIKIIPRENNDVLVSASNGLLLFEKSPRNVSIQATALFDANTNGQVLFIDGVATSGSNATLLIDNGRIGANLKLRDDILVRQQNQLDEIARTTIELFAEEDQSVAGTKPKLAGLFTWSGGPAIPPSAGLVPGIAGSITLNTLVDQNAGGNPALIRDGAINADTDYTYNTTGAAGFNDRLFALSDSFNTVQSFDSQSGLASAQSLTSFASAGLDWLNGTRQSALDEAQFTSEIYFQYTETLRHESGPNLDFEMSRLLEVERSYQATAKLIATVDEMFTTLMNSVG